MSSYSGNPSPLSRLLPEESNPRNYTAGDRRFVEDAVITVSPTAGQVENMVVPIHSPTTRSSRATSFSSHLSNTYRDPGEVSDGTSSVLSAAFNLGNGIVGAGIIGLPHALNQAGFACGVALLLIVAYFTHYSVNLMINTGKMHGKFSYEALCEHAFGPAGFYSLSLFQFVNSFGACVAYLLIVAETVPTVLGRWLE